MADTARQVALEIKDDIDAKAGYANLALRAKLAKTKLSRRDKALVTELVSGTLRRQGTLDWIITRFSRTPFAKLDLRIKNILRLALYQIFFIDNIPDYAAINEAVEAAKIFSQRSAPFVNGLLRQALRKKDSMPWPNRDKNLAAFISAKYSHPLWLVKRWLREMGVEETEKLCQADNQRPELTLRANYLCGSRQSLMSRLKEVGVQTRPGPYTKEAIVIESGPIADIGLSSQQFYAQNEASILVGAALRPKLGEKIIDLCSGPGGKSSHIGEMMRNEGEIFAVEIDKKRLKLVAENCRRLGVNIVKPVLGDATTKLELPPADRVLVDAPCSGLGVLSRRSDLRWRRSEADIAKLAVLQRKLLAQAATYIKKNGLIVYSACTNTPEETSAIIDSFLVEHRDCKIEPLSEIAAKLGLAKNSRFIQIQPYISGLDGMFIAAIRKLI